MITLETGVPGAGKTLYCVDKLLRLLVGSTFKRTLDDGSEVETPRKVYTNINGLLLDHEKIGPGCDWVYDGKAKTWSQAEAGGKGLNNWHEWAEPGAVIVYDEVQKPWPLAPAGSPVPPCITALETHRHMGVDFIVLTQHPMLIHANLVRLVGRHLHVRRVGNMALAWVYEWDSCSKTLLFKNALAKGPWRFDKSVFKLYKSAEAHTKQPRRVPTLVYGVFAALLLLAYFGPSSYARIADRVNPSGSVVAKASAVKVSPTVPAVAPVASVAASAAAVGGVPGVLSPVPPEPVFAGCAQVRDVCKCFSEKGQAVKVEPALCTGAIEAAVRGLPVVQLEPEPAPPGPNDAEILATMRGRVPVEAQTVISWPGLRVQPTSESVRVR